MDREFDRMQRAEIMGGVGGTPTRRYESDSPIAIGDSVIQELIRKIGQSISELRTNNSVLYEITCRTIGEDPKTGATGTRPAPMVSGNLGEMEHLLRDLNELIQAQITDLQRLGRAL